MTTTQTHTGQGYARHTGLLQDGRAGKRGTVTSVTECAFRPEKYLLVALSCGIYHLTEVRPSKAQCLSTGKVTWRGQLPPARTLCSGRCFPVNQLLTVSHSSHFLGYMSEQAGCSLPFPMGKRTAFCVLSTEETCISPHTHANKTTLTNGAFHAQAASLLK